ncbi:unnamed protein product [Calypogeia fissa]
MPRQWLSQARKKKSPVPPPEEWQKFPIAVLNQHWNRAPNPENLKTPGYGFQCLLLTDENCGHFIKKSAFQNHMRSEHSLNPENPPLGRPRTSKRKRNPTSMVSVARNRVATMGSFPARVWKQKRAKMTYLVRWALNNRVAGSSDLTDWVSKKSYELYMKWRRSTEFLSTLQSCAKNTIDWWEQEQPNIPLPVLRKKAQLPEDVGGYSTDDGIPEVDLERSDLQHCKVFFKLRKVHKKQPDNRIEMGTDAIEADGAIRKRICPSIDPNSESGEYSRLVHSLLTFRNPFAYV